MGYRWDDGEREMSIPPGVPQYYWILPILRNVGRNLGYAIAVHGSMSRDLDIVAVPWADDVVSARCLVRAIAKSVGGFFVPEREGRDPTPKPHGRQAWSIHLEYGAGAYIDISVMPRRRQRKAAP